MTRPPTAVRVDGGQSATSPASAWAEGVHRTLVCVATPPSTLGLPFRSNPLRVPFIAPGYRRRAVGLLAALCVVAAVAATACGSSATGSLPDDVDRGTLAQGGGDGGAPGQEGPPQAGTESPESGGAEGSDGSGRVVVNGDSHLGGPVTSARESLVRAAVETFVARQMPGSLVASVRVASEQPGHSVAAVTVTDGGRTQEMAVNVVEQPSGWTVVGVIPAVAGNQ